MKTNNGYMILCFAFSLFFLLFQGGKLASMLFIISAILCAYFLLHKWSGISQAVATRKIENADGARMFKAGTRLSVHLQFKFPGFWPILYVIIRDKLVHRNGRKHIYEMSLVPDWKKNGEITYRTKPLKRGVYSFSETECSTGDIFNLFQQKATLRLPMTFHILPETVAVKEWKALDQWNQGKFVHLKAAGLLRETPQIDGIREYVYGDKLSRVHWKATAKTGNWKSIEYAKESQSQIIFVLDRNAEAYPSSDVFELAVSATASLLNFVLERKISAGLLSAGKHLVFINPGQGTQHQTTLMQHLAGVNADGTIAVQDLAGHPALLKNPNTLVIFVTPVDAKPLHPAVQRLRMQNLNTMHIRVDRPSDSAPRITTSPDGTSYHIHSLDELPLVLGGNET